MNLNLSEYLSENPDLTEIRDLVFDVTDQVDLVESLIFEDCRFLFYRKSNLIAKNVSFEGCKFVGKENLTDYFKVVNIALTE